MSSSAPGGKFGFADGDGGREVLTTVANPEREVALRVDAVFSWRRSVLAGWLLLCVVLFAVHFVHLRADFPNGSRWRDWAKYTDEGWYGNAAINHEIRKGVVPQSFAAPAGTASWYVAGDFNTAVALPVWQVMLTGVFRVTGRSVEAARALSVAVLGVDCLLLFMLARRLTQSSWAGLAAVTIALSSMYWFVFDRLAILEPLATGFLLAALLLGLRIRERQRHSLGLSIVLGLVCSLLLLTKTTGLFLLPGVFLLLRRDGALRATTRAWLRDALIAGLATIVFYGSYYLLVRANGYEHDFRYFFVSNIYPHPATLLGWLADAQSTLHGVLSIGVMLPWTALLATVLRALIRRRLPAFDGAAWFSIATYLFFIFMHDNPQPRYYVPVALLMIVLALDAAYDLLRMPAAAARALGIAAMIALAAASFLGEREIVRYLRRPQYTLVNAAQAMTAYIDLHPNGNRLLLSISGSEFSLITGLPALCDDFGAWDLADRIDHYEPGWFATWNDIDYGTLQDIHTWGWLERAATFPAMDDPERNLLILYRIHPLPGSDVGVPPEDERP